MRLRPPVSELENSHANTGAVSLLHVYKSSFADPYRRKHRPADVSPGRSRTEDGRSRKCAVESG